MNYAVHPFGIKQVVRSPTVWSPWALGSSLVAWWAASDLAQLATVAAWPSRKGALLPVQATEANKPWAGPSFNGHPGVTFDGSADFLNLTGTTGLPTGTTQGEMWFCGSWDASGANSVPISYGGTGGGNRRVISKDPSNLVRATIGSDSVIIGGSAVGNQIVGGIFGVTLGLRHNGTRITPDVNYTLNSLTARVRLGANTDATATQFHNDVFAEGLIITGLLSTADQERIEGYWAHLYGIADLLPADHTYKDKRPVIVP